MGNQWHKLKQQRDRSQDCPLPNLDHSIRQQALKQAAYAGPILQYLTKNKTLTEKISDSKKYKILQNGFYVGSLSESGYPNGYGKMSLHNGNLIVGKFENGKVNGEAAFITQDGSFYQGNFNDNQAEGKGKFQSTAKTYQGEFKNNQFHGNGKLIVKDKKFQVEGQFQKGIINTGKMTWTDDKQGKCQYIGQFRFGKFHGKGVLTSKLGKYEGFFQNGKKNGQGSFQYALGLYYKGGYKNNQKYGKGTIYNPQQLSKSAKASLRQQLIAYTGQFQNGLPNGQGAIYDGQERKLKYAIYKNGVPNEQVDKNN